MKVDLDDYDIKVVMDALGDMPAKKSLRTILKIEQQIASVQQKNIAGNGEEHADNC